MSLELPGSSSPVIPLPRVPGTGPAAPAIALRIKQPDPKLVLPAPAQRHEYHLPLSGRFASHVPPLVAVPKTTLYTTLSVLPPPSRVVPLAPALLTSATADAAANVLKFPAPVTQAAMDALAVGDTGVSDSATRFVEVMRPVAGGKTESFTLPMGTVLISPSGTRRKLVYRKPGADGGVGKLNFVVVKTFSGDDLNGKFFNEPSKINGTDFLNHERGNIVYQVDAEGIGFTVLKIDKTDDVVTGVTMQFTQSIPENTLFDFVDTIEKPEALPFQGKKVLGGTKTASPASAV